MNPFAISCGDPAGIGPEIIAKAWLARDQHQLPPFFAVGNSADFEDILGPNTPPIMKITAPQAATEYFDDALPIFHIHDGPRAISGTPSLDGAQCALHALEMACGLTRAAKAGALITAPVAKSQLYQVGFRYPGQTEFVSERCGIASENAVMMLAGPTLRVIPMTVHIPLKEVPAQLTQELIIARAQVAAKAMTRNFAITSPRLMVAGLNPHAGESGTIGEEEITIMMPAIERLRAQGLDIQGPAPADTLFHEEARRQYDILLCPYHDQALAPLKTLHFYDGVNMTLGLPIVRTSPDHGTAFDLAGRGAADARSMIAAIEMAQIAVHNRTIHDY